MKIATKIEWMKTRYELEQKRIATTLNTLATYSDATPEQARKMFDNMETVSAKRTHGWLNEDERWAIAFYAQKLPRYSTRRDCSIHLYDIAAKFGVSLATVYRYANYTGS